MQDTVPSSKDESVFNKALADIDEIDGINRKLAPAVSEGKVLYHVIMRSLIPQDASFNQQNEFVTIINDINHDFPGVKEKIIAVTDEQMKDPGRLKEFLESCENGRQVALDFAVDNDKYLKSLPPGARVLIFEPKDNNLGNFRQLLGIIAALRAIQIEDYQDRIDKLLRIYRILTGSAAPSEIPSPGDSPEDFARKFRFVLPAIELHDPDSHVRLNDRLRILLRNA